MAHVVRQLIRTLTGNELKDSQFNSWPEARAFMLTLELGVHETIQILDDVGSLMFEYINPHKETPTPVVLPEPEVVSTPVDTSTPVVEEVTPAPAPKKSKKSAAVVDTATVDPVPAVDTPVDTPAPTDAPVDTPPADAPAA